jgi:predicted transcriptional regulator
MSTTAEDRERGRAYCEAHGIPEAETREQAIAQAIAAGVRMGIESRRVKGRFEGVEALVQELSARVKGLEALAQAQAAQVKELSERATLHDGGIWTPGERYEAGAVVTHQGSAWVCEERHVSASEFGHGSFRLMVKRGRDGR